ncbi:hypothetical protein CAPTEDRAFT_217200, partial [Capitella teleta]
VKVEDLPVGLYGNITLNDVQLAAAYYPILIDLAKHKHRLTYGELGECGSGFTGLFDPVKVRSDVYAYDWSEVTDEFDLYIKDIKASKKPRKKLSKSEATDVMAKYYQENRSAYPDEIRARRKDLIALIMDGLSEKEAFEQVASQCE